MITGAYDKSFNCVSSCNHTAISPDGNTIGTGHLDSHVRFWSLRTEELVFDLENAHTKPVSCVQFSRIGTLAVSTGKDSVITVIDLRMQKVLRQITHREYQNNVNYSQFSFSPDSRSVAVGSQSGDIFVWDVDSGRLKECLKHHKSPVTSCNWSASGLGIVSADKQGNIVLWSLSK